MDIIYKRVLDKLKGRKFAEICESDYLDLVNSLYLEYIAHNIGGDPVSPEHKELRHWVYDRVSKDMAHQRTGYLNDHFCIGTIFGMFRLFDSLTYNDKVFTYWALDEEIRKKYGVV